MLHPLGTGVPIAGGVRGSYLRILASDHLAVRDHKGRPVLTLHRQRPISPTLHAVYTPKEYSEDHRLLSPLSDQA